jgi:hypothetical protein
MLGNDDVAARRMWEPPLCTRRCGKDCHLLVPKVVCKTRLVSYTRAQIDLVLISDLTAKVQHGVYPCAGLMLCRVGYCFARGISENVLDRVSRELASGVLTKEHAARGKEKLPSKRRAVRDWILKEAAEFGDDDPGGSGKVHMALVDCAEWYEMYTADLQSSGQRS